MAKNRRIVNEQRSSREHEIAARQTKASPLFSRLTGVHVAAALMAVMVVYVAYWTHDSIEVPAGAARYLVTLMIITAAIAVSSYEKVSALDSVVDAIAWGLAGWMALSLVVNSTHANVRLGINELGWWIATASLISISRRVTAMPVPASLLLRLLMAVTLGVAIYGWHQLLVGFPEMIRQYEQNPEATLRQLGIQSQGNSAMRIVFENRLRDGGPTGTFALANSMAAMLIGGFVAMIGWLAIAYRRLSRVQITVLVFGIAVVGVMVLATRSRTAVVALFCVTTYMVIVNLRVSRWAEQSVTPWRKWFVGAASVFVVLVAGVAYRFGSSEWIQEAPASLLFRLRYWAACWGMFLESPWFGIGPGQFKSAYESFRVAEASEQIADPHQFVLQTLAAGGLSAMLLLLACIGLMFCIYRQRTGVATAQRMIGDDASGVTVGIWLSLIGVWVLGAMLGQLPTVEPAILATTIAGVFYGLQCHSSKEFDLQADWPSVKKIAGYAAFAIGIDLLASGGITVPGVSVIAWTFLAIAVPVSFQTMLADSENSAMKRSTFDWPRTATIVSLVLIAVAWYAVGVLPVEKSKEQQNRFAWAWGRGQIDTATRSLEQAAQADRWDVTPLLSLVDVYRTLALSESPRRAEWLSKWLAAESEAAKRASRDPVMMRQLGDQRLLYYQRTADRNMLDAASLWYAKSLELSPSHEAYAAQWAEVLRELGDPRAAEIAHRAERLSHAGGYYERLLNFTMIYEAKPLKAQTMSVPAMVDARSVLAELLSRPRGLE